MRVETRLLEKLEFHSVIEQTSRVCVCVLAVSELVNPSCEVLSTFTTPHLSALLVARALRDWNKRVEHKVGTRIRFFQQAKEIIRRLSGYPSSPSVLRSRSSATLLRNS